MYYVYYFVLWRCTTVCRSIVSLSHIRAENECDRLVGLVRKQKHICLSWWTLSSLAPSSPYERVGNSSKTDAGTARPSTPSQSSAKYATPVSHYSRTRKVDGILVDWSGLPFTELDAHLLLCRLCFSFFFIFLFSCYTYSWNPSFQRTFDFRIIARRTRVQMSSVS